MQERRTKLRFIPPFLLVLAAVAACGGSDDSKFTAAVFGDIPYGTSPTDTSEFLAFPAHLKSINSDPDVSLALDVGDIHSGKEFCTQAYDVSVFNQLKNLTAPLVYTPGDNEWADCHKAGEGGGTYNASTGVVDLVKDSSGNPVDYAGGNPVDNLALVRSIFFSTPGKTIGGSMTVHSQAQEVANRTGAALRWLKAAFDHAASENASAVVILEQADMWDADGKPTSHIAEYKQYIDLIAARTTAFGKAVLLLNGDSHTYRSENPLVKGSPCVYEPASGAAAVACTFDSYVNQAGSYDVPNFHRVVVHGSTTPLEWLKLTVDPAVNAPAGPNAFGPFSWQRIVQ